MEAENTLDYKFHLVATETNQANKALVLAFQNEFERASLQDVEKVIASYSSQAYVWHGVYPFETQHGAAALAETFWKPLLSAWEHLQRRQDIFIAGESVFGGTWVTSMGHFCGMFERDCWVSRQRAK